MLEIFKQISRNIEDLCLSDGTGCYLQDIKLVHDKEVEIINISG